VIIILRALLQFAYRNVEDALLMDVIPYSLVALLERDSGFPNRRDSQEVASQIQDAGWDGGQHGWCARTLRICGRGWFAGLKQDILFET
jgi:hypothetical protein